MFSKQQQQQLRMDYEVHYTAETVEDYVATQPLRVKRVLDIPWLSGGKSFRVDAACLQPLLDSSRPSVETIAPSNHLNHRREEQPKAVDNGHVLLPFNSLVEWISLNMKCRHCRVLTETSSISKTTFGIATELHHNYPSPSCIARKLDRENDTMKTRKVDDDSEDDETGDPADKNAKRCQTLAKRRNSRFAVNWGLVAGNQLFGESQKAGEIVAGFLDLADGGSSSGSAREGCVGDNRYKLEGRREGQAFRP
jgi:hypothetical protein